MDLQFSRALRLTVAAIALALTAACEVGSGGASGPGEPASFESFQPAIHCGGVRPDPRFASRCGPFRRNTR